LEGLLLWWRRLSKGKINKEQLETGSILNEEKVNIK